MFSSFSNIAGMLLLKSLHVHVCVCTCVCTCVHTQTRTATHYSSLWRAGPQAFTLLDFFPWDLDFPSRTTQTMFPTSSHQVASKKFRSDQKSSISLISLLKFLQFSSDSFPLWYLLLQDVTCRILVCSRLLKSLFQNLNT